MDTIKIKINNCKTKIIAHRGFACCNLENTIEAFKFACKTSAYGVECDIQPVLGGKLFVFHDASFRRLANRSGYLRLMFPSVIKKIELESNGKHYKIPSFKQYLLTVTNKVKVIELKGWFDVFLLKRMLNQVKKLSNINDCIFISFNLCNLKRIKKLEPNVQTQFLCEKFNDKVLDVLIKYGIDLNLSAQSVNNGVVKKCHKNNIKVNVWTVDDKQKLLQLVDYGVDFITTNRFEIIS